MSDRLDGRLRNLGRDWLTQRPGEIEVCGIPKARYDAEEVSLSGHGALVHSGAPIPVLRPVSLCASHDDWRQNWQYLWHITLRRQVIQGDTSKYDATGQDE